MSRGIKRLVFALACLAVIWLLIVYGSSSDIDGCAYPDCIGETR